MRETIHPRTARHLGRNLFDLSHTEVSNAIPFLKAYLQGLAEALKSHADLGTAQRFDLVMDGLRDFMSAHGVAKVSIPVKRVDPKELEKLLCLTDAICTETPTPRGYGEATRVTFTVNTAIEVFTDICEPTNSEYQRDVSPAAYKGGRGRYERLDFLAEEEVEIVKAPAV